MRLTAYPGTPIFFCAEGPLVDHFKKFGAFIYTTPAVTAESNRQVAAAPINGLYGDHTFYLLDKAARRTEDPDYDNTGFGGTERSGFVGVNSRVYITQPLLVDLNKLLSNDRENVRRISSWPIERCFVYIDVSDFSKMPAGHQALVINSIVSIVENTDYWPPGGAPRESNADREAMICIGDGYIFVFRDALKAAFFAAFLAHLIEFLEANGGLPVPFHFRMGAHIGRVYSFWDPGRKDWNYIGDGINGGQRVLSAVGKGTDDVLFVSGQLRKKIMAQERPDGFPDILGDLHNRGIRLDKHKNPWRVYEVNHTNLMSRYDQDIMNALRG
jgi:hypothetical protein